MAQPGDRLPAGGVTGVDVAVIRPAESSRPDRLFDDPFAARFAAAGWEGPLGDPARDRHLSAWIAVRTRFLDEVVLSACAGGCRQVVILGAASTPDHSAWTGRPVPGYGSSTCRRSSTSRSRWSDPRGGTRPTAAPNGATTSPCGGPPHRRTAASLGWQAQVFGTAERSVVYGRTVDEVGGEMSGAGLVDATRG